MDPERRAFSLCTLLIQNHHVSVLMQIELFYFAHPPPPHPFAVLVTSKYKRFLSFPQEDNKTETNQ